MCYGSAKTSYSYEKNGNNGHAAPRRLPPRKIASGAYNIPPQNSIQPDAAGETALVKVFFARLSALFRVEFWCKGRARMIGEGLK